MNLDWLPDCLDMLVTIMQGLLGECVHLCCHQKLRIDKTEQMCAGLAELWCFILVSGLNVKRPTWKLCDNSDKSARSAKFEEIKKTMFFPQCSKLSFPTFLLEPEGCGSVGWCQCSQFDQKSTSACKCHHTYNHRD